VAADRCEQAEDEAAWRHFDRNGRSHELTKRVIFFRSDDLSRPRRYPRSTFDLFLSRTRLILLARTFGQHARGRNVGNGRLDFVLPTSHHVALAVHHCLKARFSDVGWIVLFGLADFRILQARPVEELRFGGKCPFGKGLEISDRGPR
jgi:hypothetical protein